MNRQQFMQAMEIHLRPMEPQERAELLADYDQHFELGLQEGRTEEEIARELAIRKRLRGKHSVSAMT